MKPFSSSIISLKMKSFSSTMIWSFIQSKMNLVSMRRVSTSPQFSAYCGNLRDHLKSIRSSLNDKETSIILCTTSIQYSTSPEVERQFISTKSLSLPKCPNHNIYHHDAMYSLIINRININIQLKSKMAHPYLEPIYQTCPSQHLSLQPAASASFKLQTATTQPPAA